MKVCFVSRTGFGQLLTDRLATLREDHPDGPIEFVSPREAERIYAWWDGYDKDVAGIIREGVDGGKIVEIYTVSGEPAGEMIELIP